MALTDAVVKNLRPKDTSFKKGDEKGLYVHVMPNGSKYWRMKYRYAGKEKTLAIGVYPEVSLAEARDAVTDARKQLKAGADPSFLKQQEKHARREAAGNSFEAVAREWHATKKGQWADHHANKILRGLEKDVFPQIGLRPVSEIDARELLRVIKRIEGRNALDIASRTLQRVGRIFQYAIQTSRASYNPAADLQGTLKTEKVSHRPAMSREGLPDFLRKLNDFDRIKTVTRLALRLLVLTFVRPGELRGARWKEFNLKAKQWRIPAERMKMRAPHIVHLSPQAISVLKELKPQSGKSEYLFPSDRTWKKPMSENALSFAMKRMGYQGTATAHGFRSTASTILNETGFKPDVIERQLAHVERNKVRAAYHRAEYLDERAEMLDWWGNYLEGLEKGADVVPIREYRNH